jgi:hypothetical protein
MQILQFASIQSTNKKLAKFKSNYTRLRIQSEEALSSSCMLAFYHTSAAFYIRSTISAQAFRGLMIVKPTLLTRKKSSYSANIFLKF